jgi:hypothetical protein
MTPQQQTLRIILASVTLFTGLIIYLLNKDEQHK